MGRDYEGAADYAKDEGALRPQDVSESEVQAQLRRFFSVSDPNSSGAQDLINKTTKEALDQQVRASDGAYYAKRGRIKVYEDRWGNLMGQVESDLGSRKKLVDKNDR